MEHIHFLKVAYSVKAYVDTTRASYMNNTSVLHKFDSRIQRLFQMFLLIATHHLWLFCVPLDCYYKSPTQWCRQTESNEQQQWNSPHARLVIVARDSTFYINHSHGYIACVLFLAHERKQTLYIGVLQSVLLLYLPHHLCNIRSPHSYLSPPGRGIKQKARALDVFT